MLDDLDSTDVKNKIIKASRELFVQKGLKGTTVRDIAKASGTNVSMVNYYFGSKEKLFEAIFEESFTVLVAKVFSVIDSDLPFFEMIRQWVYSYYDILMEHPLLPVFVLNELSQNPTILEEKLKLGNPDQVYSKLSVRISEEEQKGTIRKIPVSSFFLSLVSLSIFPFVFKPIVTTFLNLPEKQYKEFLEDHKEFVIESIFMLLQPRRAELESTVRATER